MLCEKKVNELTSTESINSYADELKTHLGPAGRRNLLAIAIRIAPKGYATDLTKVEKELIHAGQPIAQPTDYKDEALNWYRYADRSERRIFFLEIWDILTAEKIKDLREKQAGKESQNG